MKKDLKGKDATVFAKSAFHPTTVTGPLRPYRYRAEVKIGDGPLSAS